MKLRRIDFYPDDFLVGVVGLSAETIGVYWVLCSLIYSTGAPIREDDERLYRLCGLRKDHLARVIHRLVASAKVVRNGCELVVKRCSSEVERAANRVSRARENGARGNEIKALQNAPAKTPITLAASKQQPTDNNQEEGKVSQDQIAQVLGKVTGRLKGRCGGLPPAERKSRWQGKIISEAQRTMTGPEFTIWLEAFGNDEKWAKAKAEEVNDGMTNDAARQIREMA